MEKTMTLNLRVNPTVKQQAEDVLKQLGIPMATAIDMYLRQITLTGGIPFSLSLPKAPAALNADTRRNATGNRSAFCFTAKNASTKLKV